jgi:hypothetical protein
MVKSEKKSFISEWTCEYSDVPNSNTILFLQEKYNYKPLHIILIHL